MNHHGIAISVEFAVDRDTAELQRVAQDTVSLETPVGEDEDGTLGDLVEDLESDRPPDVATFSSLQDQLAMALEGLNEREREVLIMRFSLGMDNREIARALGRTDGATKVLIHRSIKQLQEEMDKAGGGDDE